MRKILLSIPILVNDPTKVFLLWVSLNSISPQIGQSVLPGHPLGLPIQMPVQPAPGIPTGHLLTVTSGANIAVVGGIPPGHIIPKPMNVTDTTPSGQGVVMSPVSIIKFTSHPIKISPNFDL